MTTKLNVPIARTSLTEDEIQSVLEPLRSGWLVQGPKVREFEEKWSEFTGAKHSIAVTSCTTGLHLSLVALGIQPGDEVIVPAFTWVATANVVEHVGAKVVFCDIDLNTFNIDITQLESKVSRKTKAIIPVHLFGLSAEMNAINALAKRHNIAVIEDAACGFGGTYGGKHVGTLGDTASFSFHPRKAITTGEGGMITTQRDDVAEQLRRLRDHGAAISDLQRHLGPRPYLLADHPLAGYNQRMTDIQAALGASQMSRAGGIVTERRSLAVRYDDAFGDLSYLRVPAHVDSCEHGYQSYPCLFMPERVQAAIESGDLSEIQAVNSARNEFMDSLQKAGVSTRPATHAVHMLSFYQDKYKLKPSDMPCSYAANDCSISFPLFHGMTEDEQSYVIEKVREYKI
ncbi:DegT/DnrJ/EryC1/StrS family aminotransferase [Pseudohongiella sp.]|uniref:DegT/DnrJ/EryC1/StrS aminotransferase n=1 Tax=marine sediment metagenome TaxID=412755 RepID=A0A0F9YHY2_9ZZZZ|nr:DegT/DnrJ/EryC1/StrS family aminotransferase [Pseudohongiella sp.]